MQNKLGTADWKRIEDGLTTALVGDTLTPAQRAEFAATLDRIQFHNKTGPYALKLVH